MCWRGDEGCAVKDVFTSLATCGMRATTTAVRSAIFIMNAGNPEEG